MTVSSTSGTTGTYINIDALVQQAIYTKTSQLNSEQKQLNSVNTSISGLGKIKSSFFLVPDNFARRARGRRGSSIGRVLSCDACANNSRSF